MGVAPPDVPVLPIDPPADMPPVLLLPVEPFGVAPVVVPGVVPIVPPLMEPLLMSPPVVPVEPLLPPEPYVPPVPELDPELPD